LLSYDCAPFIAETLASVLAQDAAPMEILVSDDASTDDTPAILERGIAAYHGPHQVHFRQRETNSGSKSAHLNDALGHSTGEIIVSFDGDDIYQPTRVRRLVVEFARDPAVRAVYSSYDLIDEAGKRIGPGKVPHPPEGDDVASWFARVDAYASGSTLAVRREVFEQFGPLDPGIHEDIILPFRASLFGRVQFVDEPLVSARRRAGSLTADYDRYASLEAYRQRMRHGIDKARRHLEIRRNDLHTAASLAPTRRQEFDALRAVAEASMADAELTAKLVAPRFPTRMGALRDVLRSGAYRDDRLQHACLALIPDLYLGYKRRQLGIGGSH
jgi:glycosyltransferase involved in cell wall biosynthesis